MTKKLPTIAALKQALKKLEEAESDIESTETQTVDITVEAALRAQGIYYIVGDITSGGLKDFHQDILLKHMMGPGGWDRPIQLVINSGGGDLDEANAFMDLLANIRMDVHTTGMGTCGSAAAMLLCSGTKGQRRVTPSATVMVHRFTWGIYDKQAELVARRGIEDAAHNQMVEFWMKHSKYKTKKDVEKYLLRTTDTWMTAKQALDHGIVDSITTQLR